MEPCQFEPFQDRLSRDIRNALSETIAPVLAENDLAPALAVARRYLAMDLPPCYGDYIRDRLTRYAQALEIIRQNGHGDAFTEAMVLWDLGLFFEVHEVLEEAWNEARGEEKKILQALIRAAGFYIKLEYGYEEAAAKMAARAVAALEKNRQAVPAGINLELLLEKLKGLAQIPPKLRR
ncbi:DUF309 domain-containing protein [Thiovibrio sp. JS02]